MILSTAMLIEIYLYRFKQYLLFWFYVSVDLFLPVITGFPKRFLRKYANSF